MRTTRKLTGPLAVALALSPLGAPVALARPADQVSSATTHSPRAQELRRLEAGGRPTQDLRSADARDAAEGRSTADAPMPEMTRPLVEITRIDRFDWTDAAIGAGGAAGLLAISLAGAMTFRRRQSRSKPATS
jgi:hypothetical protein